MGKLKRFNIYLCALLLVVIEQVSKLVVVKKIRDNSITIIKDILRFSYCENKGGAFSIGNGYVPMFILINVLIICGLIIFYEKNAKKFDNISKIFFTMVIAGGTSNLLDRIIRGYVIDFIDINGLFQFAIFNVADIYIVVGIVGLFLKMIVKEMKS